MSHPTGVRGLKYAGLHAGLAERLVAPHWGAWIEIPTIPQGIHGLTSRTPLGCVD